MLGIIDAALGRPDSARGGAASSMINRCIIVGAEPRPGTHRHAATYHVTNQPSARVASCIYTAPPSSSLPPRLLPSSVIPVSAINPSPVDKHNDLRMLISRNGSSVVHTMAAAYFL